MTTAEKGSDEMAGKETNGVFASVPQTENTVWFDPLCSKQSFGKICSRRNRGISMLFVKVGEAT